MPSQTLDQMAAEVNKMAPMAPSQPVQQEASLTQLNQDIEKVVEQAPKSTQAISQSQGQGTFPQAPSHGSKPSTQMNLQQIEQEINNNPINHQSDILPRKSQPNVVEVASSQ